MGTHETGDVANKVGVEGGRLLDVAVLVVDDGTVHARSGHVLDIELLDEVAEGEGKKNASQSRLLSRFLTSDSKTYPHDGSCLPVTGMMGISGRVSRRKRIASRVLGWSSCLSVKRVPSTT